MVMGVGKEIVVYAVTCLNIFEEAFYNGLGSFSSFGIMVREW